MKEGFASVEGATELTPAPSEIELMIRAGMDKMALNTSPDGTPIKDGADLCEIFQKIRVSMSSGKQAMSKSKADIADANAKADAKQNVNVKISTQSTTQSNDAEIVKQVDDELRILIPGGFLSCPLLQYPPSGAPDDAWLSWLQELPRDFAARVFFMSLFVDERAADMVSKLTTQLNTPIDLSTVPQIVIQESFLSMCTPGLSEVKQKNADAATCVDLKTQDQKKAFVTYVLNDMLETKRQKILKQFNVRGNDSSESAGTNDDIRKHISNAKANLAKMQDIGENVLNGTMIPKSFDNVKGEDTSNKKCAKRFSAVP